MAAEDWTDVRIRVLKRHWGRGKKNAREIGDMIGMSRNAVIGKAQRMFGPPAKPRPKSRPPRSKPTLVRTIEPTPGGRIRMALLTTTTCRYPYGERPRDLLFCGAEVVEGSPYCPHHEARCHQPRHEATSNAA